MRGIDVNKGDKVRTKYTSRLLAKEFRQKGGTLNEEDLFAGTPLLEALRLLVSKCVTDDPESQRKGLKNLLMADVKRAYFNAPVQEEDVNRSASRRPIGRRR